LRLKEKVKLDVAVMGKADKPQESLSYVEPPQQLEGPQEEFREKLIRKTRENPLVPLGA